MLILLGVLGPRSLNEAEAVATISGAQFAAGAESCPLWCSTKGIWEIHFCEFDLAQADRWG
jgi:hypothetical protein